VTQQRFSDVSPTPFQFGVKEIDMNTTSATLVACGIALCGTAAAQTTVPYASAAWKDFGTTNVTGVTGNFLPGWTSLTASPDLGDDLFFNPSTSLSGADGDAAIWMLNFDLGSPGGVSNESVRLSLDGFTIGETYELDFWATILQYTWSGWDGNDHALDVALVGADVATFSTSILNDPVENGGLNVWTPQSIVFEATSTTITFDFGGSPTVDPGGDATRFGFDGVDVRLVPTPASSIALALGGLATFRRRR